MLWVRLRWRKNLWLCLRADSISVSFPGLVFRV